MNTVHFEEVNRINPEITSKEAIMQVCREIVAQQGFQALNMRTVAKECSIALGTLYNYYSDKDELLIATIGSIWRDIFHLPPEDSAPLAFPEYVARLFSHVQQKLTRLPGFQQYPNFFTAHSAAIVGSDKEKAKDAMELCFEHIRSSLLTALRQDKSVNPEAFTAELTEECFVEFVLDNILILLVRNKPCGALTQIIRSIIY